MGFALFFGKNTWKFISRRPWGRWPSRRHFCAFQGPRRRKAAAGGTFHPPPNVAELEGVRVAPGLRIVPSTKPAATQPQAAPARSAPPQAQSQAAPPGAALARNVSSGLPNTGGPGRTEVVSAAVAYGWQPAGSYVTQDQMNQAKAAIAALNANGQMNGSYEWAKARCMINLAEFVFKEVRTDGSTEYLFKTANMLADRAKAGRLVSMATPQIPGYRRHNPTLWSELNGLIGQRGAQCAPAALACASVSLLGADYETEQGYGSYKDHGVSMVENYKSLAETARKQIAACPEPKAEAPVPVAQAVQVTKPAVRYTAGANALSTSTGSLVVRQGGTVNMSGNRIQNVGDGVENGDAVNRGQLNNAVHEARTYTDNTASSIRSEMASNRKIAAAGVAAAMAMSNGDVAQHPGTFVLGAGMGAYDGSVALGVSGNYLTSSGKTKISGGVAGGTGGKLGLRVGVSMAF